VANSALTIATRMGMDVTCCALRLTTSSTNATWTGRRRTWSRAAVRCSVSHDIDSAYAGADVVYAKSWGALPYFGRLGARKADPRPVQHFIVDEAKMALTNSGVFSHCLPLRRNVKATDAVMDSPACIAIDEAENRLHVQKADDGRARSRPPNLSVRNDMTRQRKDIVLAFSGGLDTSFCVPYLQERGWTRAYRVRRHRRRGCRGARLHRAARRELGVASHVTVEAGRRSGTASSSRSCGRARAYQGQYPLLVSDRYLIVDAALSRAKELGTNAIAHGCTGMGNDQVRFDLAVRPVATTGSWHRSRDPERAHPDPRLRAGLPRTTRLRRARQAEAVHDQREPARLDHVRRRDRTAGKRRAMARAAGAPSASIGPLEPLEVTLRFEQGEPVALDGEVLAGHVLLARLNKAFAAYGVGRGIYTGDTTIGLKGRIILRSPGLVSLLVAHRALEEGRAVEAAEPLQAPRLPGSGWKPSTKASSTIR
jgi:argininosuccinate synthase